MSMRIIAGSAAVTFITALLGGCAADEYSEFYKPNANVTAGEIADRRLAPPPSEPELVRGEDPSTDVPAAAADGYLIIGSSSFNGAQASDANAMAQAKVVGADRVLTFVKSASAMRSAAPMTTPTAPPSSTSDSANGVGNNGTATALAATTSSGTQTSGVPISADHYDYLAVYLVKARFAFGASYRNLSDKEARTVGKGVMIVAVVHGSPAADAGLLPGDAIVRADRKPVIDTEQLNDRLRDRLGESISLTIVRGGNKLDKTVKLATL